tara:strand:+ start:113646 stop:114182 length:537 start_codon:yes stop_codon:yes gene_type:complete
MTTPGEVDTQVASVSADMVSAEHETSVGESEEEMMNVAEAEMVAEGMDFGELGSIDEDLKKLDEIENILDLEESEYPVFTLAKNKARFLRMLTWYKNKEEWLDVAPLSGVSKLFKQQSKELEGIRSNKLDYEMELETGTLTPSQRSYRKDELKMCKVHEKMAVNLISKMQVKIKSGRR